MLLLTDLLIARTLITSFNAEAGENALTTDVTAAVQGKSGKITLMFTDNAAGADLYGKLSGDKAPVLKITKGKVVTFNVAARLQMQIQKLQVQRL